MNKKWKIIAISVVLALVIIILIIVGATKSNSDDKEEQVQSDGQVTLQSQEGNYSLSVTAVYDVAPETDEAQPPEAKRVAVVVYEYTNDDISHGLSIGNTHFKAYDSRGKELEQYPQKNLFEASEIGESGTFTASVAFALNDDNNFIKVEFYNDISSKKPDAVFEKNW